MKKGIFILVYFLLRGMLLFSQFGSTAVEHEVVADADKGYYVNKSVRYNDIWILKENKVERAKRIIVPSQARHVAKTLYPEDIEEYGFPNGVKYISATISFNGSDRRVFLEEIVNVKDEIIFYVYSDENKEDIFFILEGEKNELRKINSDSPEEVWNIFKDQNDCSNIQGLDKFPKKLTRKRVNVFYRAYKDCNPNLFPQLQIGPVANIGIGKPKIKETPEPSFAFSLAFSAGVFFQLPFDECTALRCELLYSYLNSSGSPFGSQNRSTTFKEAQYIRHSINVPLLIRYTFNFNPWRNIPYVEMGAVFDYSINGGKYKDGVKSRRKKGEILDVATVIPFQYGYALGVGIEHKLTSKKSLYLGARHKWVTGSRKEYVEKLQSFEITLSVGF
jgi:hypothetical protein